MGEHKTFEGPDGRPYDAIQFTGNFDAIEEFVGGDAEFRGGQLVVATIGRALTASPTDWIVRNISNEFSVVPDAVMRTQYRAVRP